MPSNEVTVKFWKKTCILKKHQLSNICYMFITVYSSDWKGEQQRERLVLLILHDALMNYTCFFPTVVEVQNKNSSIRAPCSMFHHTREWTFRWSTMYYAECLFEDVMRQPLNSIWPWTAGAKGLPKCSNSFFAWTWPWRAVMYRHDFIPFEVAHLWSCKSDCV